MQPERIDHIVRKPCISGNFYVLEKAHTIIVEMEPCWFFKVEYIRPPTTAGHNSHIFFSGKNPFQGLFISKRKVRHNYEEFPGCFRKKRIERLVEVRILDCDLDIFAVEQLGAYNHRAAVYISHSGDDVYEHSTGKRLPLLLAEHTG